MFFRMNNIKESRKIGKIISKIEKGEYKDNYRRDYSSHVIGITGPLGVGKSTIVYQLGKLYAEKGKKTGIILNDPASESGGSFLGDRIRMQKLSGYKNVFIRSLSSKDAGGISGITRDAVNLLEKSSFEKIIVESVGAGQSEIEIASLVDTCIVVLMPGMGDEIQMLKSGINEIADIFVVNKSDKKQAQRTLREVEMLVNMKKGDWKIPVVLTSAIKNKGISELMEKIKEHHRYFKDNFKKIRKLKLEKELRILIKNEINKKLNCFFKKNLKNYVDEILTNKKDTSTVAKEVVNDCFTKE
ncbi:methylmalonyl Co-A mutase-associated GTPase MeaB [Candidatus Woesearchaeota archaeon]|nr:methylmalonyl Co-A mutase-associated GTPase MeaB [Candidatus Woesearchaeota archaeon]